MKKALILILAVFLLLSCQGKSEREKTADKIYAEAKTVVKELKSIAVKANDEDLTEEFSELIEEIDAKDIDIDDLQEELAGGYFILLFASLDEKQEAFFEEHYNSLDLLYDQYQNLPEE